MFSHGSAALSMLSTSKNKQPRSAVSLFLDLRFSRRSFTPIPGKILLDSRSILRGLYIFGDATLARRRPLAYCCVSRFSLLASPILQFFFLVLSFFYGPLFAAHWHQKSIAGSEEEWNRDVKKERRRAKHEERRPRNEERGRRGE